MKIRGLVLALGLLMAFGCQNAANNAPAEELVAKVNGEGITNRVLIPRLSEIWPATREGAKASTGIEQRIKESVLRRLIDDAVIRAKAGELSVVVSDKTSSRNSQNTSSAFEPRVLSRLPKAFEQYDRTHENRPEAQYAPGHGG